MIRFINLTLLLIMMSNVTLLAQKEIDPHVVNLQLNFFKKYVNIPEGYQLKKVSEVPVDEETAYLLRYTKNTNSELMGEHFSFVVSKKKPYVILGFTDMSLRYTGKSLASKDQCDKIAKEFLMKIDPQLAKALELQWIDKHDEEIIIDGQKKILTGMKYKCYCPSSDEYAWVIVAEDNSVITFERNIRWSNGMMKRLTEKWLHDTWLVKK